MSEETQHTPGPWQRPDPNPYAVTTEFEYDGTHTTVCQMQHGPYGVDTDEERIANARLIAAAPDLLKAAKTALDALNKHEGIPSEASDKLASAIAKAEGRT